MGLFISAAQAAEEVNIVEGVEHGGEHGSSGLPQVDFSTFPSQIFWFVVAIVVLYMLFSKIVLPRIGGVIEERHDAIEDDLDRAAEFKRRAEAAEKAYQAALAEARAEAQRIGDATRAEIQKDIDAAIAKADAQIAAKTAESETRIAEIRAEATVAVREVALSTAHALAEAVAPGVADAAAVDAAVAARTGN